MSKSNTISMHTIALEMSIKLCMELVFYYMDIESVSLLFSTQHPINLKHSVFLSNTTITRFY